MQVHDKDLIIVRASLLTEKAADVLEVLASRLPARGNQKQVEEALRDLSRQARKATEAKSVREAAIEAKRSVYVNCQVIGLL